MEHAYEKLMKEHNLSYSELPNDAKIGIDVIQQIVKAVYLAEKTGKKVKPKVYDKIKANDKWVTREILDYVDGKETHNEPLPNKSATAVIESGIEGAPAAAASTEPAKTPVNEPEPVKKPTMEPQKKVEPPAPVEILPETVIKIDEELKTLADAGKTTMTLEEVKAGAPTAYNVIFDGYEPDGQNGIETTYYSLIETQKEIFTLTKK